MDQAMSSRSGTVKTVMKMDYDETTEYIRFLMDPSYLDTYVSDDDNDWVLPKRECRKPIQKRGRCFRQNTGDDSSESSDDSSESSDDSSEPSDGESLCDYEYDDEILCKCDSEYDSADDSAGSLNDFICDDNECT